MRLGLRGRGRASGRRMPCGWRWGVQLTASQMRARFTDRPEAANSLKSCAGIRQRWVKTVSLENGEVSMTTSRITVGLTRTAVMARAPAVVAEALKGFAFESARVLEAGASPAATRRRNFRPLILCLVPALWMMFNSRTGIRPTCCGPKNGDDQSRDAPKLQAPGAIYGAVKDSSGSVVVGAIVTLETAASMGQSTTGQSTTGQRTTVTDDDGSFHFSAVDAGNYKITIAASGFAVWTAANVAAGSGEDQPLLSAVLQVAPVSSSVHVTLSQRAPSRSLRL